MIRNPILLVFPTNRSGPAALSAIQSFLDAGTGCFDVLLIQGPEEYIPKINSAMEAMAGYRVIGIMADDVRMKTAQWDRLVWARLADAPGILYGPDGIQNERMATHPFISREVIAALGFVHPPSLKHYFGDSLLTETARRAGCLQYAPGLILEHLHHSTGKSSRDDIYASSEIFWSADETEANRLARDELPAWVERLKQNLQKDKFQSKVSHEV